MPAYRFVLRRGPAAAVAADVPMAGELLLDTESRTVTVGDGATAGGRPLSKASVGLGNVDNTSDAAKPVSTAQAAALALKAPLASPAFTGAPTCPEPVIDAQIANKKYVDDAVAAGGGSGGGTSWPPAYWFGGGRIEFPSLAGAALSGGVITISVWVRPVPGGTGSEEQVICRTEPQFNLRVYNGYAQLVYWSGGTVYKLDGDGSVLLAGQWHHLLARVNTAGGVAQLYIDGKKVAAGMTPWFPSASGPAPMYIGSTSSGSGAWRGQIRDVAIWQTYLSDAALAALFCSVAPADCGAVPTFFARLDGTAVDAISTTAGNEVGLGSTLFVVKTGHGPS